MNATAQKTSTIGQQYKSSDALNQGVDAIVTEMQAKSAQITEVRPPTADLKLTMDDLLERAEASRGRGLMIRYIGSGIGAGPLVELVDGSIKYDMICGIGPNFFGHSDPDLVATALRAAAGDVTMQGYFQQNAEAIECTETFVKLAGRNSKLAHAFLCNSGAMANDNAIKICFHNKQPANRVLLFKGCFMGRSLAMAQFTDNPGMRNGVPVNFALDYVPFYNEKLAREQGEAHAIEVSLKAAEDHIARHPGKHAAFSFELVQGEGGFNPAPREFFVKLMELCKANNIAVMVDEVQTFGRTTEMFAFDTLNLGQYVDICTVGKMSQVCATIYTDELNPKPGLLSATFLGSTVSLNVGHRILNRLADGTYYGNSGLVAQHRKAFDDHVRALAKKLPDAFPVTDEVPEPSGGFGGMMRLTPFGGDKNKIMALCKTLFDEGVISLYCGHGPFHVRFLPPLGVMQIDAWPNVFEIVERAITKVAKRR